MKLKLKDGEKMAEAKNYFQVLYDIDISSKASTKNNLTYLPWAAVWAETKKIYPSAEYVVYENADGRFWFDDGRTGWVKTGVVINGIEHIERLPIMNHVNKPIPAESITSFDANKSVQRSITKACGRHGVGLYVYEGEDLPESTNELNDLNDENFELAKKIAATSADKKAKVKAIITEFVKNGNPRAIREIESARKIREKLMEIM